MTESSFYVTASFHPPTPNFFFRGVFGTFLSIPPEFLVRVIALYSSSLKSCLNGIHFLFYRAVSADHNPAAPISNATSTSNLKNSKKISRSISLLAPWKPRNYKDKFEVIHYDNRNLYANPATSVTVGPGGTTTTQTGNGQASGKPPRPPVPPVTRRPVPDKKSASSTDLLRDTQQQQQQLNQAQPTPASASVLERRAATLQRPQSKVSRSVSMPKDSRLAGWFKKRKRS